MALSYLINNSILEVLFIPSLCSLNSFLSCCHDNIQVCVWNVNSDAPCSLPWLFPFCFLYVGCSCFKCDNSVFLEHFSLLLFFSMFVFEICPVKLNRLLWLVCLLHFWPFCDCRLSVVSWLSMPSFCPVWTFLSVLTATCNVCALITYSTVLMSFMIMLHHTPTYCPCLSECLCRLYFCKCHMAVIIPLCFC